MTTPQRARGSAQRQATQIDKSTNFVLDFEDKSLRMKKGSKESRHITPEKKNEYKFEISQ